MEHEATLSALHQQFCQQTGADLRMGLGEYNRLRYWYDFHKAGFTAEDLKLSLDYLKAEVKATRRNPGCLKFSNLIVQLDRFEEDLQLAKGWARNRKPAVTAKDRVVALRERVVYPARQNTANTASHVSEYINALRQAVG